MIKKIDLKTQRMPNKGDFNGRNLLMGLDELCKKYITSDMVVLELGCHKGISTMLFAHYAKTVHTVDNQECPKTIENVANIIHHQGRFQNILPKFADSSVDIVYIDGDHKYAPVCRDIKFSLPLVKESGFISGHDFIGNKNGVARAIRDVIGIAPEIFSDSSWFVKKADILALFGAKKGKDV